MMRSRTAAASIVTLCAVLGSFVVAGPVSAAPKGSAEPVPIPGGFDLGGGNVIHVYAPGPEDAGLGLTGINSEPNTITNFNGLAAYALFVGSAVDSDGNPYDAVLDMRAFEGEYVSADGTHHHGTFGFI
jgi:hypothetical protein